MRSIITIVLTSLALTGCTKDADSKLDQAREAASEALDSVKAAAGAQGDSVRKQLETRLRAVTAKIEKLDREAKQLTGKAREDAESKLDALKNTRDEIAAKLRESGDKGGDAWDAAKSGLGKALDDLESAYEDVKDKLE